MQRFIESKDIVDSYVDILKRKISETANNEKTLMLFNTLIVNRDQFIKVKLSTKNRNFEIYRNNKKISFDILNQEKIYYGSINKNKINNDPNLYYYISEINIKLNIKALSFITLNIKELKTNPVLIKKNKSNKIENQNYKITFIDKKINVYIKKQNILITDFINIVGQRDDGDTYDFSPLKSDKETRFILSDFETFKSSNTQILKFKASKFVYQTIEDQIKRDKKIKQNFDIKIILSNKGNLDFDINGINLLKDYRVRVELNPKIKNLQEDKKANK